MAALNFVYISVFVYTSVKWNVQLYVIKDLGCKIRRSTRPRKYKRPPGARNYKKYYNETLLRTTEEIKIVSITLNKAKQLQVFCHHTCYRAEHLYDSWTGGPPGTRYNRSQNGWFNSIVFEDWFFSIAIPYFKKFDKCASKVVTGDNLSSHISLKVIQECKEYNICIVLLPPDSKQWCQPLDTAYFWPLKRIWRTILNDWKTKHLSVIPGKSVCEEDLQELLLINETQSTTSAINKKKGKKRKTPACEVTRQSSNEEYSVDNPAVQNMCTSTRRVKNPKKARVMDDTTSDEDYHFSVHDTSSDMDFLEVTGDTSSE
ncbi:hypothetical protein PR048_030229 [Dryococelus australis]|uniref:DDE-1 domain-containing protein n=1 Tax=Dryococelus australis TaxID=614101 RepID=A0ABQ9G8C8_9NEOP|nr:hypothetical protein PR048_030229 [Dryococelus australis]